MNTVFPSQSGDIGTDPTTIEIIDSLDVLPDPNAKSNKKGKVKKGRTPNPDKKPHDTLKKILFVIIVLLLMGGVAFGLYYYLSLGTKNKKKMTFTLKNIQIYVGGVVSNNITDYGDFSQIDVSACTLEGIENVDVNLPGKYEFSVMCDTTKKTATIEVLDLVEVDFATKIVYKAINEIPSVSEFIITDQEYDYLTDEIKLKDYVKTDGGPYGISIEVSHKSGNEKLGYAALYVLEKPLSMTLKCTSQTLKRATYEYNTTDVIAFDDKRENMDYSLRLYNFMFYDKDAFNNALLDVNDNKIKIDNREGYFIMDTINNSISIITKLSKETLNKESDGNFAKTYTAISSYYTNTKNYNCET